MNAAERYVLGELPANLRDAYEAHYFDCAECALEVRTAATFVDAARDLFRVEARNIFLAPVGAEEGQRVRGRSAPVAERAGWFGFGWLRPALKPVFVVPVFAAALAVVVYQNTVQIPHLKLAPAENGARVYGGRPVHLLDSRRGESGNTVTIPSGEGLILNFDFTPSSLATAYNAELRDPSGRILLQTRISGDQANQELHLPVSPDLVRSAGTYVLVFTAAAPFMAQPASTEAQPSPSASQPSGESAQLSARSSAAEVQRLSFAVAFRN